MPGPMPYYLEKGPAMSILEDFINTPGPRATEALKRLRAKNPDGTWHYDVVDCGAFDTPALNFSQPSSDPTQPSRKWTVTTWKHHMNLHWFGVIDKAGKPFDAAGPKTLGQAKSWWINYFGEDVEGILRSTIIRAVETAYRVKHGDDLPEVNDEFAPWPIELFWKCGQSWFEGWVTWRQLPGAGDRGVVTAMLATPSENTGTHYLWWSPVPNQNDGPGRGDPFDLGVDHLGLEPAGTVVITHSANRPVGTPTWMVPAQQKGQIPPPPVGATYHGTGPVVVVRPAETRGGVASAPRRWTPSTSTTPTITVRTTP